MTLEAAKEWGVPPWVIDEEAPYLWVERWRALRDETAIHQERQMKQRATNSAVEVEE